MAMLRHVRPKHLRKRDFSKIWYKIDRRGAGWKGQKTPICGCMSQAGSPSQISSIKTSIFHTAFQFYPVFSGLFILKTHGSAPRRACKNDAY